MLSFSDHFLVQEAKFRKSKYNVHLFDVPMFSIFLEKESDNLVDDDKKKNILNNIDNIKSVFSEARNEIHRIGFPSMHVNVVLSDLNKNREENENITAGMAIGGRRYMKLNYDTFLKLDNQSIKTVVHEWAHLWMMHNKKDFIDVVEELWKKLVLSNVDKDKIYEEHFDRNASVILNEVREYINYIRDNKNVINVLNKTDNELDKQNTIRVFNNSIKEVLVRALIELDFDSEFVRNEISKDFGFVDKLSEEWYDSLKKTANDSPHDIEIILDEIKKGVSSENSVFYKISSRGLNRRIDNIILIEIHKLYQKYKEHLDMSDEYILYMSKGSDAVGDKFRNYLKKVINWYDSYGMTDSLEFWATAIEGFFELPYNHKRMIVKLILDR